MTDDDHNAAGPHEPAGGPSAPGALGPGPSSTRAPRGDVGDPGSWCGPTVEDDLAAILGRPIPAYLEPLLGAARVTVHTGLHSGKTRRMLAHAEAGCRAGKRVVIATATGRDCACGRPAVCVGGDEEPTLRPTWCCAVCCAHAGWCARVDVDEPQRVTLRREGEA